jgi:hypothetical protein|tara:strand:+ start:81 stop:254 length:174 start_codon:yes stop_codon:yes gene_type:complete
VTLKLGAAFLALKRAPRFVISIKAKYVKSLAIRHLLSAHSFGVEQQTINIKRFYGTG